MKHEDGSSRSSFYCEVSKKNKTKRESFIRASGHILTGFEVRISNPTRPEVLRNYEDSTILIISESRGSCILGPLSLCRKIIIFFDFWPYFASNAHISFSLEYALGLAISWVKFDIWTVEIYIINLIGNISKNDTIYTFLKT